MVVDETKLEWVIDTLRLDARSFGMLTWHERLMSENMNRAADYLTDMQKEIDNMIDMDNYQTESLKTVVYPAGQGQVYTALGLANEAGEVAGVVKKIIRDDANLNMSLTRHEVARMNQEKIKAELGDVLWYLAAVAKEYNLKLSDVAQYNMDKLKDRGRAWCSPRVRRQPMKQVRDQVRYQVRDQVRYQVRDQVGDQVWDQVRVQVRYQVRDQVGDQVWDQVRVQVREQTR
jgi:NTP pyrophosphatase (non-canonical NTP hydrolase)